MYYIKITKEGSILDDLEKVLNQDLFAKKTEEEPSDDSFSIKKLFNASFFEEMEGYLKKILEAANYLNLTSAYLHHSDFDVVVNGKAKAMDGKGYRAFLNTVFALALVEYLREKSKYLAPPLIIDSPILTLKEGVDDHAPDTMKAGLFEYLLKNSNSGQVIIIENEIPNSLDYSNTHMIEFTKGKKPGRYGLLPGVKS